MAVPDRWAGIGKPYNRLSGRVHLSCEDGKLYTLDANGVLLWSYDTNSPLLSSPTIGPDGSVFVGAENGKLYAIDINGNLRWTHSTNGFIYSSPAVSPDGNVYACSQDGILYALGQDGSELWSFETAGTGVIHRLHFCFSCDRSQRHHLYRRIV